MVSTGAEIQPETGFVRIHPAILELLARQQLGAREFRCLLFLFRKTYGYQKKEDKISTSQWEEGTGIPRTRVGEVLDSLIKRNLIYRIDQGTKRPAIWGFNKHFETWQCDETVTPQGDSLDTETVTPQGDSSVTPQGDSCEPSVTPQGDKTVTPTGDNNRKKESVIDAHGAKPPKPKAPPPNAVMFERLCFILFGHTNTRDGITDKQRGLLNSEVKRLQRVGATQDDLGDWYKQVWRKEWPGKDGQSPRVPQVLAGVTAWVERRNGKTNDLAAEANDGMPTNGVVTGFSLSEVIGD